MTRYILGSLKRGRLEKCPGLSWVPQKEREPGKMSSFILGACWKSQLCRPAPPELENPVCEETLPGLWALEQGWIHLARPSCCCASIPGLLLLPGRLKT